MHYHSGVGHIHDYDDPLHEHEMATEYERIHGLRFVEGQETFDLTSVGIDIGSSTSHLMFSRLVLMRIGGALSSRFEIVERDVTYASPILLTPYVNGSTIDVDALGRFIADSYAAAGVERDGIDAPIDIFRASHKRQEGGPPDSIQTDCLARLSRNLSRACGSPRPCQIGHTTGRSHIPDK